MRYVIKKTLFFPCPELSNDTTTQISQGPWKTIPGLLKSEKVPGAKYSPWRMAKRPGHRSVSVWGIREREIYGSSSASGNQERPLTRTLKCCSTGPPCTDRGNVGSSLLLLQSQGELQPHQNPISWGSGTEQALGQEVFGLGHAGLELELPPTDSGEICELR